MFRKSFAAVISIILLVAMSFTTVFAAEAQNEAEGIAPMDSALIVELDTQIWTTIFSDNLPLLFSGSVTLTSNIYNSGDALVRIVAQDGSLLVSQRTISPGESIELPLRAADGLLSGELYFLQAKAVDENAAFAFIVDKGNEGYNIRVAQLSPNTWVTIDNQNSPLLLPKTVEVTNHEFSPAGVLVRLRYTGSGDIIYPEDKPLAPGESYEWTIPAALNMEEFVVEVKSDTNTVVAEPFFFIIN